MNQRDLIRTVALRRAYRNRASVRNSYSSWATNKLCPWPSSITMAETLRALEQGLNDTNWSEVYPITDSKVDLT